MDAASWAKTKKELQDGALIGLVDHPWPTFPTRDNMWCFRARYRNSDDCLQGGQNDPVGLQYTNRLADQDAWTALNRGMQERFPDQNLAVLTSDFKGAYNKTLLILIKPHCLQLQPGMMIAS